jgi:hypothetical protein
MKTQSKAIAQARCGLVKTCDNHSCIFNMMDKGYQLTPTGAGQHNKNQQLERLYGKGFVPMMREIFRDGFIDVVCDLFIDKDRS